VTADPGGTGAVTVDPIHPRLLDRSDLLATLDRASAKKVAIISAPAGSGKSSLLRAWADRGPARRLAVVAVQRDQDVQTFWLALLRAVRQASGSTTGVELPAATPEFNPDAMADRVLSELVEADADITLVIDDLHELDPEALGLLTHLLADLPQSVNAILATRRDLQLGLHRLRLAGELAEIRAEDLRFTEHETRELLDAAGVGLSESAVALLHQRTEGWAAGIRLAAIALTDHPDPERFVAEFSGSNRTVAEYLVAEMLERQPAEVQQLLLRTSLLERVNGELADLLTGGTGSERILLELEDANAFVVSLDPERTWFRYHHLFADLLRLEVRRTLPAELPVLHRRAAEWFIQHGQIVDAIRHTQAAGEWSAAARLLADYSFSLTLDGQAQTIQALLQAFPAGGDHPELALVRAGVDLVEGRLDESAAHVAVAEAYLPTAPPDRQRRLRAGIAWVNLSLSRRRGHLDGVAEQAAFLAQPVSGQSNEDIALDNELRTVALMNLGIVEAWTLRLDDAQRHLREGADLARTIGRPYLEVGCLAQLGFASKLRSFAIAQRHCNDAIALAERHGWSAEWLLAPAFVTLAETMTWMAWFDDGERWRQRAAQVLQADTGPGIRLLLHMATGMLHAGRGHLGEAFDEFSAAEGLQSRFVGRHGLTSLVTGWTSATRARLGRIDEARAALAGLDGESANWGEVRNAAAVVRLEDGDPPGALDALKAVFDGTAPVIHDFTVVEAHLLSALALHRLGDLRGANRATERALGLAEPERLVLPFVMTGSKVVLEALPRHETAHAALLADVLDVLNGSALAVNDRAALPPTEELTAGELRVLRFLPTNLSRPEIASQLSVSVNTVNTHVRNIYTKLQASDRSSAVQRARDLRLLSAGPTR